MVRIPVKPELLPPEESVPIPDFRTAVADPFRSPAPIC